RLFQSYFKGCQVICLLLNQAMAFLLNYFKEHPFMVITSCCQMAKVQEKLQKFILGGQYDIKANPSFSLEMVSIAKDLAPVFYGMNWAFLEATDDYKFVTSDNPLFYVDLAHDPRSLYGVGLSNKNIEVTFPISQDLMFFGTWQKFEGYKKLNNKFVKEMNRRTISSALRFVFASQCSDKLNRLVQKYKDSTPRMKVS
ncbi:DUF4238 domain-containing protein, partial [bacterium]|nr:DUF4238 domain-containing protein [bacterium]